MAEHVEVEAWVAGRALLKRYPAATYSCSHPSGLSERRNRPTSASRRSIRSQADNVCPFCTKHALLAVI
jgi:hypothetical protein